MVRDRPRSAHQSFAFSRSLQLRVLDGYPRIPDSLFAHMAKPGEWMMGGSHKPFLLRGFRQNLPT